MSKPTRLRLLMHPSSKPAPWCCAVCYAQLEPCPRGKECIGTPEWSIHHLCICLHGQVCPTHGSDIARIQ